MRRGSGWRRAAGRDQGNAFAFKETLSNKCVSIVTLLIPKTKHIYFYSLGSFQNGKVLRWT